MMKDGHAPQQKDRAPGHEWKNNTTNLIVDEQHLDHRTTNTRVEDPPFFIRLEHRESLHNHIVQRPVPIGRAAIEALLH